jgi:hypothetical protein
MSSIRFTIRIASTAATTNMASETMFTHEAINMPSIVAALSAARLLARPATLAMIQNAHHQPTSAGVPERDETPPNPSRASPPGALSCQISLTA